MTADNLPSIQNPLKVDMLESALNLYDKGFWPIPCHWVTPAGHCSCRMGNKCPQPGKHPFLSEWKSLQTRRLTRGEVEEWWTRYPSANIGVVTGPSSGLVCIDIDVKRDQSGKIVSDGRASLAKHADEGRCFTPTLTDKRGDGLHFYYRYPIGVDIRSGTNKLGEGIDIRAKGGLAIIAPSMHHTGERRVFTDLREPTELPEWIADLVKTETKKRPTKTPPMRSSGPITGEGIPRHERLSLMNGYISKRYPDGVIAGIRHHFLVQVAGLLRGAGADRSEIEKALIAMNEQFCKPPKENAHEEISRIAEDMASKPGGWMTSREEEWKQ